MANFEKGSSADGSDPQVNKAVNPAYLIDERRRAALAEIDNAQFS
jgi:PHS family inorganic phosphate transporter-like MFS transporter